MANNFTPITTIYERNQHYVPILLVKLIQICIFRSGFRTDFVCVWEMQSADHQLRHHKSISRMRSYRLVGHGKS